MRQTFCDFEFDQPEGEMPRPLSAVFYERESDKWTRLSSDLFSSEPPFDISTGSVFVAYAADAELLCFRALGWQFPANVIDLHVEYLNYSNRLERSSSQVDDSLLAVLAEFRIDHISSAEKDRNRAVAMSGGPKTPEQWAKFIEYNETDVRPLPKLYDKLIGAGNLAQALERGRYMKAVATMQATGTPMDVAKLGEFRAKWESLKWRIIDVFDRDFGCYDGLRFSHDKFKSYVARRRMSWPSTDSGLLKTDKETFKERALLYPEVAALHELKSTLGLMKRESISIGRDGRNRCSLHPYRSKTGRNQPAASRFIWCDPSWMRSFVKPAPGRAISYIDYEQQEFLIAAGLSHDKQMQKAYQSGDPYLAFAKMAGALPPDATKASHPKVRELFKTCALGVQYGMQSAGLAHRLGRPEPEARALIEHHHNQFPEFWSWVDRVVSTIEFKKSLCTASGWRVLRRSRDFPAKWRRSAQNWLIQSTGADLLRLCCCLVTERGISLCAPIHDAILIEDSIDRIERTTAEVREIMESASRSLLDGLTIRTEVAIFYDRFVDKRGVRMWDKVMELMADCEPNLQGTSF
jgi:hypothetical protein